MLLCIGYRFILDMVDCGGEGLGSGLLVRVYSILMDRVMHHVNRVGHVEWDSTERRNVWILALLRVGLGVCDD